MYLVDSLGSKSGDPWEQVALLFDDAMGQLSERERNVVVLRFMCGHTMKDVGTELGINEGAARKRVARATEKLRAIFAHRGLNVSTSALADSISAHAVEAAPDGLAESAVLVAFAPNSANQSARAAVNETLRAMTVAAWQNDVLLVVFWLLVSGILVVAAKGISLH